MWGALLAAAPSTATVALLPVDVAATGADGPRVRAALVQALRAALRDELRVVDAAAVPQGAAVCAADVACVARVAGDDADEVLAVRVDRSGVTADVWARLALRVHQVRSGRVLTFEAPVSTTAADRDVRALVLRAYDPARLQGRLDVVGVADDDIVLVDGLRAARLSLRLRPGRHEVVVLRPDGARASTMVGVALDEQATVDVAPWSLPASSPTPSTLAAGAGAVRPWWPLVTHAALATASMVGLGVVAGRALGAGIPALRDVEWAGGISLLVVSVTATSSTVIEATRLSGDDESTARESSAGRPAM